MNNKGHEFYMRLALNEAARGEGLTSPNPPVGAVVVKKGKVLSAGYHRAAGKPHAEVEALKKLSSVQKRGSSLYVTLEPCSTYGRTPPCTDAIIESRVRSVYIAALDPNPFNRGRAKRILESEGIKVTTGVLRREAQYLYRPFRTFITKGRPYYTVKVAQSLDGKIATDSGDSKWITSAKSRRYVHLLRRASDAVLVGIGTLLKDDPLLNARAGRGRLYKGQPLRVIMDPHLKIKGDERIFSYQGSPVWIITSRRASRNNKRKLSRLSGMPGIKVVELPYRNSRFDLNDLNEIFYDCGIVSMLIEGGRDTITRFAEADLIDRYMIFVSNIIIGGTASPSAVGGRSIARVSEGKRLDIRDVRRIGNDTVIEAEVRR